MTYQQRRAAADLGSYQAQARAARRGHPRHQLRTFHVRASHGTDHGSVRLGVEAQTEHDALLRAGMELNARYPGSDPARWRVAAVTDPAPAIWTPPGEGTS